MTSKNWIWADTGALLALGLIGGTLASLIGLPLPFMLGSLIFSAIYTLGWSQQGRAVQYPKSLRFYFIAVIGTMIGTRFTPELPGLAAQMWPSFLAVLLFVIVAHGYSYLVLRRVGGYDLPTAVYGALPGGLIEAVVLGEKAGGDVRILTVHHFTRIIFVVLMVPLLFLWLGGESVGSSGGQTMENGPVHALDIGLIVLLSAVGMWIGRVLKLPAGQLIGPLLLCGAGQVTGVIELHNPGWLLNLAQLVVGAGLGAQFAGVTGKLLLRACALSAVTVSGMLAIGAGFAIVMSQVVPGGFEPMFISFAPGGVTEMALIALSLDASPVIVTAHHIVRILFAVVEVSWIGRLVPQADQGGAGPP